MEHSYEKTLDNQQSAPFYKTVDEVLITHRPVIAMWRAQGDTLDEAIAKVFQEKINSRTTADQDVVLMKEAVAILKSEESEK